MEMTETDKLLVRIGTARDAISRKTEQTSLDYMIDGVLMNCSVMLKEQQQEVWELQELNEYLTDQQPKTGHWLKKMSSCPSAIAMGGSRISACDLCGGWGKKTFKYCPHCGAKMEKQP